MTNIYHYLSAQLFLYVILIHACSFDMVHFGHANALRQVSSAVYLNVESFA